MSTVLVSADYFERMSEVEELVVTQAEDEGLWFEAETAPEAYLQEALRKLHRLIEGEDDENPF